MTRTDLPKLLQSTMYQAADINSLSSSSYKQRDSTYGSALEESWINTKGHCQIFNTDSVQKPKYNTIEMEYQYRKAERYTGHPEVDWNAISQQQRHRVHRFSSPDLLNLQVNSQPLTTERVGEVPHRRRTRARSTPQVQTNLIPVRIKGSPPGTTRSEQEFQRSPKHQRRRPELSPRKEPSYAISKALTDGGPDKMSTSPHVKCRVDIKPDEATFEQHGQKPSTPKVDLPWLRYASGDHQSLTVPFHFSVSRTPTPTPTEPFVGDYRATRHYSQNVSNAYMLPLKTQRMPDQREMRDYYEREQRAHSSPNVASKYFHEKDMAKYVSSAKTRPYYQDDYFMIPNQTDSPKVRYVQEQKANIVHTIPARSYFTQIDPYHESATVYPKSCASHEPGQYIIQTPPAHTFYGDDPRTYQVQKVPPRIFYMGDSYEPPLESEIPAYLPQDLHHAHMVQPESHDWYGSDVSSFSTYYPFSFNSQVTPTRVRQEPMLASWYNNSHVELTRTETDPKPYSRSWDNILSTQIEREQPVHRGKSDENLLCQGKQIRSTNGRRKPVVVNLSSSPRRYAALSLSDNSLIEKDAADARSTSSKQWVITPEITITDNDIKPGKNRKAEERSVSCDVLDAKSADEDVAYHESQSFSMKEKTCHSASLQQSLEQLDKLLADLVIDYKPSSSGGPGADLVDQLEKLIYEDEAAHSSGRMSSKARSSNIPLDKQPTSIRVESHTISDRSCNGLQSTEECSPDQSPDEDDTMICSNNKCRRIETLFNACLYFKSCHSCYTYYCSRNCRREDWDIHKATCLYGRTASVCRHIIKHCRETAEVHKAFSRIAKVGYLSRGRGVLFLGFPNPGSSANFLQCGLESLLMHPTYLSLRELDSFKDNLGEYCKELQEAGKEYDPNECFLLNVSIAVGEPMPDGPSPRVQAPTVRKYAKVALASYSPERKVQRRESDMETLILTPPPGTADIDKEGEEGRKAREICFINIQRELRIRGVFLRHEYPHVYQKLCEFVESNRRFTPTTIYPIDKRTGNQFMCMIMAASEPRTLDWVATPHLLDDII